MKKRSATDTQFLVVMFVLVLLLGVQTTHSLLNEEVAVSSSQAQLSSAAMSRQPASIPNVDVAPEKVSYDSHVVAHDLNCLKKVENNFSVVGGYFQLKGKNCFKNFHPEKMEIFNRSNGYTASVLPFGREEYQTDMIQLRDGSNEIVIKYKKQDGSEYEQILNVSSASN